MVELRPLPTAEETAALWSKIAGSCRHSFFVSWPWIETWLHCIQPQLQPRLLLVHSDTAPIAAGIVVARDVRRYGFLPARVLALNTAADAAFDCICIEYNDLLVAPGNHAYAWRKICAFLRDSAGDWDELRMDGVPASTVNSWPAEGLLLNERFRHTARSVDLQPIRASGKSFLDTLPSRDRRRIMRTKEHLEAAYGALQLSVAATQEQALEFFCELKTLHEHRWRSQNGGGAFGRPFFERFHRSLIVRHFSSGAIKLVRLQAGATVIGLLYTFVHQGCVSFYQSGFNFGLAPKGHVPGLLVHALTIDHCIRSGHDSYDLMGGESQYKRMLASDMTTIWWGELRVPRLSVRLELLARNAFRKVKRIRIFGAGSAPDRASP